MKKIVMFLFTLTMTLFTVGLAGSATAFVASHYQIEINPIAAGGVFLSGFVIYHAVKNQFPNLTLFKFFAPENSYTAAITQEFWVNYIIENLFKANSFLNYFYDESAYVLNGKTVHIPQAGSAPTVVKNRSSYPATASQRTDTEISYDLDNYSTNPIHMTHAELNEISYDKMGNVLSEHVSKLRQEISDDLLIKCAPSAAAYILRTTGADASTALSPSATGTRKKLTKEDLQLAQQTMDELNIPEEDRYALIPSAMYAQLLTDSTLLGRDGIFGGEVDIKRGICGELFGFKLMKRSSALIYDNTATPVIKAFQAAGAATDNMGVFCWQRDQVAKAMGDVKFFENLNDATYQGDVYSALIKMGGRKRRTTGYGVVAITQAA